MVVPMLNDVDGDGQQRANTDPRDEDTDGWMKMPSPSTMEGHGPRRVLATFPV